MMIYVMARMLWDPNQDPMPLVNEFVDLHYGRSAPSIHEFLLLAQKHVREHPGHSNCNGKMEEFGLTPDVGLRGIELFERAISLADDDAVRDRVEQASIAAYRIAIGTRWYGDKPVPEAERAHVRRLARRLFSLTNKHHVAEHREGTRMSNAENRLRKALGMADDEPF